MKTLLALLGGITVGAQPVALMAEQTGVFDLGSRAASLEGVDEGRVFDLFDKGESQEEGKNKLSAMSNKNYGIGKAKTFNIDNGDGNMAATTLVATYKYNDGTDSAKDIIYNISSNGSGGNAVIKNENNIGEKVLTNDIYKGNANNNSFTTSFLSTYQSSIGLTSKNNYMAYMSGTDGAEGVNINDSKINFMDFSTGNTVEGATIKVPDDFYKVSKIYSPTRILGNKNDNQLYMLYQNNSSGSSLAVAQYDLSDKIGNDGKFNNLTSWVGIKPSYIYSIKAEGNINGAEFTLGNDNIPTVNFNDGSGFNSYGLSNEGFKPGSGQVINPSVNHLSGAENLVIDYITNTDHQDSDYQYTIVAAHEISNPQNSSVYYVGGDDKKTLIPLFSLNPQSFSAEKNIIEDNKVNGFYSYSDSINQNYNLVVTTSNSVYQYSYTVAKDISLGGQARKILFVDTPLTSGFNSPIYGIAMNSIIYSEDQLKYIFTDSDTKVNSYIGSIFEKLNLSTINTNDLTYKPDYPLNGSEQYESDMIEKLESGLKSGQLSKDQKVTKMFEESEDGDYKIYLEESERNKLIPENKFGKIQASGEFVIEAGDTPTSRFRGAKRQTVIADYKNRFNLSELANQNSQFKVWEDGYELNKYDDFNSVIGWVYNQVQNSLEKINGFQNEVMWKELESTEWEINNWQNGAKADNFNSGWGLFGANSISTFNEETGKTQVVLNGIKIQPKKGADSDYFYVENGSEENKQTYVELPKLVINVDLSKTTIDGESTAAGSILNEKNKLDLNEKAKGVSKLQFNGIGLTTENTLENRIKIQNRLNKHLSLDPALGLQLININSNNYYSFEQISSKITVRLFDRAFAVDGASTAVESSNKQGYNYTTIEITIYGLKKPSSLPRWVTPILAFGGLSIFILLIMSAWFISRKRFYKSAVGKEAAKIAQAKRREEKTKK